MKGYYEGYSYVLIFPDGRKLRIATESEINDYVEEERSVYDGRKCKETYGVS